MGSAGIGLTILGEGPAQTHLEQLRDSLGLGRSVRFVGFRPNPYPYLAQADCLVLSSRYEGFPNVVLEALACQTPVVATPIPGIPGLLAGIPECEVAASAEPDDLAAAIRRLVSHGRQRVGPDAVKAFDVGQVVGQYQDLFLQVIADRGR